MVITINGKYAEDLTDLHEKWLSICDKDKECHNVLAYRNRLADPFTLEPIAEPQLDIFSGINIVTNSGDLHYAQSINGTDTLTENYRSASNRCELQNPVSADTPAKTDTYTSVTNPITASRKAIEAGYPKSNDDDPDNTGAGADILTWEYNWTTSDFNTAAANDITGGCIHNSGATPMAADDLLTHWNFTSAFEKLSTDTLKVFVNHEFRGV